MNEKNIWQSVLNLLLVKREVQRGLASLDRFGPSIYRETVGMLAYHMVVNGTYSIDRLDAVQRIRGSGRLKTDPDVAEGQIRSALVRSGLIRETQEGKIDFIYDPLRDYLSGEWCARFGDYGLLLARALDPAWLGTIRAAVLESSDFANRMISNLLDAADASSSAANSRSLRMLAQRCAEANVDLSTKTQKRLKRIRDDQLVPATSDEARFASALSPFSLRYLKYRRSMAANQAIASIRTLGEIGTESARALLREYSVDNRGEVLAELEEYFSAGNAES